MTKKESCVCVYVCEYAYFSACVCVSVSATWPGAVTDGL